RLHSQGIHIRVLSMPTVKPLDEGAVIAAAKETGGIVTAEEHSVTSGLGSAVADVFAQAHGGRPRFLNYGIPDRLYHDIGSQSYLRRRLAGDLEELVVSMCGTRLAA